MSDGGTAFPWNPDRPNGMSLRDYFAAAALTGLLAKSLPGSPWHKSQLAYAFADAMIQERAPQMTSDDGLARAGERKTDASQ